MLYSTGSQLSTSLTPTFVVPPCPWPQDRLQLRRPVRVTIGSFHMSNYDSGLTDDGDFAIFGVNAKEETEDGVSEKDTSNNYAHVNTGTSIGWQGVGNMLFNEELLKSGRVDMGVGPTNKYRAFRGNEIIPKVDPLVKEWLLEIMPALDESDLGIYAEGLTNIGFHPQCASMCELKYEDLDFMKILHRRYLYKEITGQDHPFEP